MGGNGTVRCVRPYCWKNGQADSSCLLNSPSCMPDLVALDHGELNYTMMPVDQLMQMQR
jgi:hypothetical protein